MASRLVPGAAIEPRVPPRLWRYSLAARSEIERAVREGRATRVRRGCYAPHHERGPSGAVERDVLIQIRALESRLTTAHWFSHTSAALLWGCWTWHLAREVHVVQQTRPGQYRTPGDPVVRHVAEVTQADAAIVSGLPVTSLERTVLDCARSLPLASALVIADSALRIGVDPDRLRERASSMSGARGIRRAGPVLDLMDARSGSPGETLVRLIAHEGGLPGPDLSHEVETSEGTFFLDLAWVDEGVAVEFDGDGKYGRRPEEVRAALLADARRDRVLRRYGWIVVHLSWEHLQDPEGIVTRIRSAMAEAARIRAGVR